ncbi:hypothetical protein HY490_04905 [Candidatus Woesearchaeota archaeon]|nr:hypothetical protein [Candidatus Woesearchaeota archaeon]
MKTIKTTLLLREDVHERMKQQFGKRQMSEAVNSILFNELVKTKSLFGIDKGMKPFVREHKERTL